MIQVIVKYFNERTTTFFMDNHEKLARSTSYSYSMLQLATQYCKIVNARTSGLTVNDSPFFFITIRILLLLFRISDATFDNLRVAAVLMCCFIRLMLTRIHLQSFLDMAKQRILKMKKEAGRISNITLQKNVRNFSTIFSTLKALVRSIKFIFSDY